MASIFRKDDNYVEKVPRNTYDMSFQNNLTTDFGSLRPCGIWPVNPGDSWRFKPTYGLRFLPLTFPIQTRMKASIHYFYVRNRNLWKDWEDFITRTKSGLVPPYIHLTESNRKQIETCQLGDFLGIPTKIYGDQYENIEFQTANGIPSIYQDGFHEETAPPYAASIVSPSDNLLGKYYKELYSATDDDVRGIPLFFSIVNKDSVTFGKSISVSIEWTVPNYSVDGDFNNIYPLVISSSGEVVYQGEKLNYFRGSNVDPNAQTRIIEIDFQESWFRTLGNQVLVALIMDGNYNYQSSFGTPKVTISKISNVSYDVAEEPLSNLPWRSDDNPTGIPLSALPFRAYESIYNSFYRNAENNPLLINGVPEYNRWCRTQEGGADTNFYPIMYHNWEDDFLTTAVPSPQQGNAPLVGLSGTTTLTIGHDDGTTTTAQLDVDDEGNVTAVNAQSGDEATTQALVEAVSYGITINDFRNVNAFQRWLENNIRRGYKYRDQIKTHYGVTVRYDELDMPEFIGGTSQPVMVNQISQTAPTENSVLGDMAGQASAIGSGNEITHYCDEHGFIIAILCVKPVANYSQLLPKFFNVTDAFDYYFPEFGHIGMQPITYKEVTPLQANLEGKLDDVFGYQRAWYDLISKTDEVHGLFRSDFRNFLINRTFDGTPELGEEFTVMDPNQLNEVFAVTENTDKILGQIYMDISKKTAIPLYGIPKLE